MNQVYVAVFPPEHSPLGQECCTGVLAFNPTCLIRDSIWQQASLMVIPPFHPFPRAAKLLVRANAYPASASAYCNERKHKFSFLISETQKLSSAHTK